MRDPKIAYLKNALLIEEEILSRLGIKIGILGHNRADYDIMLMSIEEEPTIEPKEINELDKKILETRKSVPMDKIAVSVLSFWCIWKYENTVNWMYKKIVNLSFEGTNSKN